MEKEEDVKEEEEEEVEERENKFLTATTPAIAELKVSLKITSPDLSVRASICGESEEKISAL